MIFSKTLGNLRCSEFCTVNLHFEDRNIVIFSYNFPSWTKIERLYFLQLHHEGKFKVLLWPSLSITVQKNFIIAPSLQVKKFKKYKTWNPKVRIYIVIVLSCPLIGSLSSSTTNQRAAQNFCYIDPEFKDPSICTT